MQEEEDEEVMAMREIHENERFCLSEFCVGGAWERAGIADV